jgi:hypothetical protein
LKGRCKKFQGCVGHVNIDILVNNPSGLYKSTFCSKWQRIVSTELPAFSIHYLCLKEIIASKQISLRPNSTFGVNSTVPLEYIVPEVWERLSGQNALSPSSRMEIRKQCITVTDYQNHAGYYFFLPDSLIVRTTYFSSPSSYQFFEFFTPSFQVVLLHASAVLIDDQAVLFLAYDEGGKTTAAQLSQPYPIIGDDRIMAFQTNGRWYCHATPWNAHIQAPLAPYPIKAFFLLKKEQKFNISPVSKIHVISHILSESLHYRQTQPESYRNRHFEMIASLVNQVPCFSLEFNKTCLDMSSIKSSIK